jgi:quinol monooxygenase YgiN
VSTRSTVPKLDDHTLLTSGSTRRKETPVGYAVAARWVAKDGEEDRVFEAVKKVIEPSRAEPGCSYYQANRDPDDPRIFFFFEVYRDADAVRVHTETAHFMQHVLNDAVPRLAARERSAYLTID